MTLDQFSQHLRNQLFPNGFQLADGVELHREYGAQFQIPPDVIKRHVQAGHFIELRIDSDRFSVHEEDAINCSCPNCHGELSKPILRHEHPFTLAPIPPQGVPSRGWGEDFWVKIIERHGNLFKGVVENHLVETRLHEMSLNDEIFFHEDHILAVHPIHRGELVAGMNAAEIKELATWLGDMNR